MRGRAEYGPRALGHRSLLALPVERGMLDRLNRLKHRQWYRPVAPMIRREDAARCFGVGEGVKTTLLQSTLAHKPTTSLPHHQELWDAVDAKGSFLLDAPYMSLAADLTQWCLEQFPAIGGSSAYHHVRLNPRQILTTNTNDYH